MTGGRRRGTAPRPPWMVAVFTHTVIVFTLTFVLRPSAIYRGIELNISSEWLGVLGASYALVPLALALPLGRLADRAGERRVLLSGIAITLVTCGGFVLVGHTVVGLFACVMLLGTGHLCATIGQQALIANRTPRERLDAAFGYYTFWAAAGQAVGPGLLLLFGGSAVIPDTRAIFLASLFIAALLVPLVAWIPRPVTMDAAAAVPRMTVVETLRQPGTKAALITSATVLAAVDITLIYLPALGAERGLSAGAIGVLLALRAVASMLSRVSLGRVVAAAGRQRVLATSLVASTIGLAALSLPLPVVVLGFVVVFAGLGLGAGQPLTMSWLTEATPAGMRGRVMSLRLTGNRLGQVALPALGGLVAAGAGASGVLLVTAGTLAGVAVLSRKSMGVVSN